MYMKDNINVCHCGNIPILVDFYIRGIANHKNYFVKCEACGERTRARKNIQGAITEWNESEGSLYRK